MRVTDPRELDAVPLADDSTFAADYLREMLQAIDHGVTGNAGVPALDTAAVTLSGHAALPCAFPFTDFATASIATASLAIAALATGEAGGYGLTGGIKLPAVNVDRRLASFWFQTTFRAQGWTSSPLWDPIAGDYQTSDGWIRLHTNAPHHRAAALAVLGVPGERDAVTRAVATWQADALETAVVSQGGCAAAMRTLAQWDAHPQGLAVAAEPLLHWHTFDAGADAARDTAAWRPLPGRPLSGIRVLDLTRILAGPTATRFLAGFGAQVLRIDPFGWDEPGTVPEVVLGKRCARLDLKREADLATLEALLRDADIVVHGYRPDALEHLGFGAARRRELNPALIDVSLDAYGWQGPWHARRGYDSLLQMSAGIADAGMRAANAARPVPLPGQGIDYATGYLMAAAAVRALARRQTQGLGATIRASLARTARLLVTHRTQAPPPPPLAAETANDLSPRIEDTSWGAARRVATPMTIAGVPVDWALPAMALGTAAPVWP
ncbi:Formyl-CoA:oxalate CoA-transferase [Pandoraea pneumonica]|uniref:Formyl-CoA:oxalate CoA-transferase n=1 Tax=Pandoraea pneumonica TaxID=2508299 RepID=A0A5E4SR70_9BURK|nr:CoA transferase [Pandoraea pneumonica]VVD76848.1 Formyl-CoA:oxalate CoA-transferase [Pandoraea pneumonica]